MTNTSEETNKIKVGVSGCLLGAKCNFNGTDLLSGFVKELQSKDNVELIPFCPEDKVFGTPRPNLRIVGGDGFDVLDGKASVINEHGKDVTELQISGANQFLNHLMSSKIKYAILMDGSPSCGSNVLLAEEKWPAGGFKRGTGVSAALLKRNEITVFSSFDELSIGKFLSSTIENFSPKEGLKDLRDFAKFKYLFHESQPVSQVRVVHAIIKQSDKFLLGKRSASKKNAAGHWASVGGRLEDGESLEVGLIRECLEEMGVNVKPVKQIKQLTEAEAAHFWFEVEIISGTPRLANDEHSELAWFTKSEAELLSPIVAEDFECIQLLDKTKIFEFKPLEREHFELLYQWLQKPHVLAWWDSENNWEDFEKRYQSMINNPLVFPHIVYKDKNPIGYINYWFVEEDPDFKPYFQKDTVGTDQFIGASELIGKGIGSDFIRQFTDELLLKPNIGLVITDPDPQNLNSIRAYEKAGFKKTKIMKTSEGDVQILEKRSS